MEGEKYSGDTLSGDGEATTEVEVVDFEVSMSVDNMPPPPPVAPVSPTSSQGSWVVQPEDGGWDGLDESHQLSPRRQRESLQVEQPPPAPLQQQRSSSPTGSWAGVGGSASCVVAVEYPRSASPPGSPGSERSEGLADLARDEVQVSSDGLAAALDDAVLRGLANVDGTVDVDVARMEVTAQAEAVSSDQRESHDSSEFKADDGTDWGDGVVSVRQEPVPKEESWSSARVEGGVDREAADKPSPAVVAPRIPASNPFPRAGTPPITASPRRIVGSPSITGPQVRGRMESSSSSVAGLRGGNPRDAHETEEYAGVEGKNMDKLWRWTAVVTAAKMGVIPIVVCAALAAISSQAGGGDGAERGSRDGGGGGGGSGRGGGGATRCGSRKRPRGGGGGNSCFPSMRADRHGCMPMPYCMAPSIFVMA